LSGLHSRLLYQTRRARDVVLRDYRRPTTGVRRIHTRSRHFSPVVILSKQFQKKLEAETPQQPAVKPGLHPGRECVDRPLRVSSRRISIRLSRDLHPAARQDQGVP
jgi:hypothetical protein